MGKLIVIDFSPRGKALYGLKKELRIDNKEKSINHNIDKSIRKTKTLVDKK